MPPTLPPRPSFHRRTFAAKLAGAALLVILAHQLFYGREPGWTLGAFAFGWCVLLGAAVPAMRRAAPATLLALAALFALVLVDDPNPLGWLLFWGAISSAALVLRRRFRDAAGWALDLALHALASITRPFRDAARLLGSAHRDGSDRGAVIRILAIPLLGSVLFLALFGMANPLVGTALGAILPTSLWDVAGRLIFSAIVFALIWPSFRPHVHAAIPLPPFTHGTALPSLSTASLMLSLAAFNAVFALQNGLDLVFLWSGAPLPDGVTLAEYAHRGAYLLIVTALLAGLFVLVALAPDSAAARRPAVRRLLVLWLAQNVLLVASSMIRLFDYILAYSLTELRLAALAWMALVATGLVLIGWRLLAGRSARWLVNANALAALVTLVAADVIDLGAVAARWNVDHARRADQLDLCYLAHLGPSALLPLIDLEHRAAAILRDRTRYLRLEIQADLAATQHDWHQWTWRGARRLAAARVRTGTGSETVRPAPFGRRCDGSIITTPLTQGSVR